MLVTPSKRNPSKWILVEPEAAVGEQEVQDLVFRVIEAARIPGLVVAARARVEILVVRAVEAVEPFHLVLDRVGMDEVHDHAEPRAVGRVDQFLEILGGAEARGGGEEAA